VPQDYRKKECVSKAGYGKRTALGNWRREKRDGEAMWGHKHEDLNIGTTSKILGSEAASKNTIAAQERENQSQKANSVPKPKLKQTQAN